MLILNYQPKWQNICTLLRCWVKIPRVCPFYVSIELAIVNLAREKCTQIVHRSSFPNELARGSKKGLSRIYLHSLH